MAWQEMGSLGENLKKVQTYSQPNQIWGPDLRKMPEHGHKALTRTHPSPVEALAQLAAARAQTEGGVTGGPVQQMQEGQGGTREAQPCGQRVEKGEKEEENANDFYRDRMQITCKEEGIANDYRDRMQMPIKRLSEAAESHANANRDQKPDGQDMTASNDSRNEALMWQRRSDVPLYVNPEPEFGHDQPLT